MLSSFYLTGLRRSALFLPRACHKRDAASKIQQRLLCRISSPWPRNPLLVLRDRLDRSASTQYWSRNNSSVTATRESAEPATQLDKEPRPEYQITFTCKKCQTRSAHKISKQGYHNGTVLVQCPGCKNRHLIADHLKIFSDERVTIEDILAQAGEELKKAHLELKLSGDGVIEVEHDGEPNASGAAKSP